MTRINPLPSLFLLMAALGPALAEPAFQVVPGTVNLAEGESAAVLLVQSGDDHFSLRIPQGSGTQVDQDARSIVFTHESGLSVITVRVTTNYPGTLPKTDYLSGVVAGKFPK